VLALLLAVGLLAGACGNGDDDADSDDADGNALSGSITVMAPAPLKGALDQAKAAFEGEHPGVSVSVSYAHIPQILAQLQEGVSADVIVTPAEQSMKQAQEKGFVDAAPSAVASTELALVVPADNPGNVTGVDSLADDDLIIALCAPDLPCGSMADELAEKAGITLAPDSEEPGGIPAIVTKATVGEIDLGLVFTIGIKAGGDDVKGIAIEEDLAVSTLVQAAVLNEAPNVAVAQEFVAFLSSDLGESLFTGVGFSPK
jgi:molybdate transport system substrate-binding protein